MSFNSVIRSKQPTQRHSEHFTLLNFSILVGELNIRRYNVAHNTRDDTHLFAIAKLYSVET